MKWIPQSTFQIVYTLLNKQGGPNCLSIVWGSVPWRS